MKDDLIAWFMDLFQDYLAKQPLLLSSEDGDLQDLEHMDQSDTFLFLKAQRAHSCRPLTIEEQTLIPLNCQRLLLQLHQWKLINTVEIEAILERVLRSDSTSMGMDEFKWIIMETFELMPDPQRLCFLESILYHNENHANKCH